MGHGHGYALETVLSDFIKIHSVVFRLIYLWADGQTSNLISAFYNFYLDLVETIIKQAKLHRYLEFDCVLRLDMDYMMARKQSYAIGAVRLSWKVILHAACLVVSQSFDTPIDYEHETSIRFWFNGERYLLFAVTSKLTMLVHSAFYAVGTGLLLLLLLIIIIIIIINNTVALVRERTIPIERTPLVVEVNAHFCG
jgi:hypothetical protein